MSLRSFHIFFISVALSLLAFMAYWSSHHALPDGAGQSAVMTISSVVMLLIGIPYLGWFIRKAKSLPS